MLRLIKTRTPFLRYFSEAMITQSFKSKDPNSSINKPYLHPSIFIILGE